MCSVLICWVFKDVCVFLICVCCYVCVFFAVYWKIIFRAMKMDTFDNLVANNKKITLFQKFWRC